MFAPPDEKTDVLIRTPVPVVVVVQNFPDFRQKTNIRFQYCRRSANLSQVKIRQLAWPRFDWSGRELACLHELPKPCAVDCTAWLPSECQRLDRLHCLRRKRLRNGSVTICAKPIQFGLVD
jgi:hypothetical protein